MVCGAGWWGTYSASGIGNQKTDGWDNSHCQGWGKVILEIKHERGDPNSYLPKALVDPWICSHV